MRVGWGRGGVGRRAGASAGGGLGPLLLRVGFLLRGLLGLLRGRVFGGRRVAPHADAGEEDEDDEAGGRGGSSG